MGRFGARIRNRATGSIQVDDLYANMALVSKDVVTTGSTFLPGTDVSTGSIMFSGASLPLIAFACASYAAIYHVIRNDSANTWTFVFVAQGATQGIVCYRFEEPPALGPGWGMRIRRDGVVKFDSRHRYAKIATSLRGDANLSSIGNIGPAATLAAGRSYAVMMGGLSSAKSMTYTPSTVPAGYYVSDLMAAYLIRIDGNALSSQLLKTLLQTSFYPVPPSPPPPVGGWIREQPQYSWAILDVTGF